MCRGERPFPLPVWHSWLSGSTGSLVAARFFFLLSLSLFLLVLIPMTWQKWHTSRLQLKGLVGFASVSISPNYGRPWTKQGRSFHHSDSWMVTCRCQCNELLKMILSRKSNSSWHSFLTKRFCWNGNGGGGAKKPFPGTPAFVLLKVFCSFWLGALPVWMPRSPLGRAWNTSWCPGGLWAETLNPRGAVQLGSENLIVDRCCGIQVVIHARSWERWRLVDKLLQCCACFAVMQAIIDSNACLYCFYSSKISELRAEYKQDSWHWWLISNGKRNHLYGLKMAWKIPGIYGLLPELKESLHLGIPNGLRNTHFHLEDSDTYVRHSCEE